MAQQHSIIILGSGGVGKSALTLQFVQGVFVEKYDPTIEDCYKKSVILNGEEHLLEILDTAGTEQFTSMRDVYMKTGEAFALVYSINSMTTFNDVQEIIEQINRIKDPNTTPIIIVGNKCDLEDEREVTEDLGQQLASKSNCSFIEASAKQKINVNEIFYDLIRQISKNKTPKTILKNPSSADAQYSVDSNRKPSVQINLPKDIPAKENDFKRRCRECCTEKCTML